MVRRAAKICLECFGALLVLAAVVASVAVWRLAQGPVDLDFLTPRVERALSALEPGLNVEMGSAELTWGGWPDRIALRAHEMEVTKDGAHVASLPTVDLDLSFPALASGAVAPTGVEVRGARLSLVRDQEGVRFAPGDDDPLFDITELLPALIEDLMAAPDPSAPLSYLNSIRIVETETTIRDSILDTTWRAPATDIVLGRRAGGLTGTVRGPVSLGMSEANLETEFDYEAATGRIEALANLRGLEPSALASVAPDFEPLSGVRVPLSATVETSFDFDTGLGEVTAKVQGSAGEIALPGLLPEPRGIESVEAAIRANTVRGIVNIDDLSIAFAAHEGDSAGPSLRTQGRLTGLGGDMRLEVLARAENVPADHLGAYWPEQVAKGARKWVTENILAGRAEAAAANLVATIPEDDPAAISIERLDGEFRYGGLDVHYLRNLPQIRDVRGTATFDLESLQIYPAGGRLGDVTLGGAEIVIDGFDREPAPDIDIRFSAEGPLRTALRLVDHPRLNLLSDLRIDPEKTSGTAEMRARFRFPLAKDLKLDQVRLDLTAQLSGVGVDNVLMDRDARAGDFDLEVTMDGLQLAGPVRLAGIPLTLQWRENFAEEADTRSEVHARIPAVDSDQLTALGLSLSPYVEGPVSVNLAMRESDGGAQRVLAAANLERARVKMPGDLWQKQAGEAGEARFDLRLRDGVPQRLERLELKAPGAQAGPLEISGQLGFAPDTGAVERAVFDRVRFRGTRLDTLRVERGAEGWQVNMAGEALDLSPVLARLREDGDAAAGADSALEDMTLPPFTLDAPRLERLVLGEKRSLDRAALKARRDALGTWRELRLDARIPAALSTIPGREGTSEAARRDPSIVLFDYGPRTEDDRQALRIEVGDTGALLRAMDAHAKLEGGALSVTGLSRAGAGSPIDAEVSLRDLRAIDAPILAQLLTVASLTGIANLLGNDGIHFQSVTGDVVIYRDGRITSENLHAYGSALGLTARGWVDIGDSKLNLAGVIVPAASINRAVEQIPLLGPLLTGGEGEGIIALNYGLSGALENPSVTVNPLSALAPGFLRSLLNAIGRGVSGGGEAESGPRGGSTAQETRRGGRYRQSP